MGRSLEYINRSQTHECVNVEIGTEVAQFPEKEYINEIFVVVRYKDASIMSMLEQNV